jgi:S-adenosylmethionine synthetase
MLEGQSTEIRDSVEGKDAVKEKTDIENIGAGDQGIMFGYATNETLECIPLTQLLANRLTLRLDECRKTGLIPYLLPDGKSQVTVQYSEKKGELIPQYVHTVLISAQHRKEATHEMLKEDIEKHVIRHVIPKELMVKETKMYINPSGSFVVGGPMGDAGLTGRKIIIDTYGGWGAHGGGAFSGKDPSKVDRSAAYAARWIAKSLVSAKLCKRILIQLSYAIGVSYPLSINVNSYGSSALTEQELIKVINENFDLRPGVIIRDLELRRPIYEKTASGGHFGRNEPEFLRSA